MIKNSWSGASFGQADVKGCYHCGRMVRDERGATEDPVACGICMTAGYKQPPTIEDQEKAHKEGGEERVKDLFKNLGQEPQPNPVPNIKNPSDITTHKSDEKELLKE